MPSHSPSHARPSFYPFMPTLGRSVLSRWRNRRKVIIIQQTVHTKKEIVMKKTSSSSWTRAGLQWVFNYRRKSSGEMKTQKISLIYPFFCAYYFSVLCKSDRQLGLAHVGSWGWDFVGQRDCFCLHFTLVTPCSTPFNTPYAVHVIFIYSWCFRYRQRKNFFFSVRSGKLWNNFTSNDWLMAIFNDFIIFLSFHPFSALKLIANQGRAGGCCTRDGTAWVGEQTFQ